MSIMIVLHLMKTHVVKVSDSASIGEAVDLMDLYQVSGLPVIDAEGVLCGYISEKDITQLLINNFDLQPTAAMMISKNLGRLSTSTVHDFMSSPAISISENCEVEEAAQIMISRSLKRLPVMSEDGQLIGTMNRIDLLRAVIEGTIIGTTS